MQASAAEIRSAYRKAVLKYHPDKAQYYKMLALTNEHRTTTGGGFLAERNKEIDDMMRDAFLRIREAFEILGDAASRRQRLAGVRGRGRADVAPRAGTTGSATRRPRPSSRTRTRSSRSTSAGGAPRARASRTCARR